MMAAFGELMAAWGRFLDLEPWESIVDDQIFSIEDEVSGETYYASILGNAGMNFGLSFARGAAGLRTMGSLVQEDIGCDEAVLEADKLAISAHVGDFPPTYRKFLRAAAGPNESLRGMPFILAMDAGSMPRVPSEDEIGLLARAVAAVADLVDRGALKPAPFRPGAPMPCIVLRRDGGVDLKKVTPVFERMEFAEAHIPEERLAAVRALPRLDRTLLVSCSIAPVPVQEGQARMFITFDVESGRVLDGLGVLHGQLHTIAERLLDAFGKIGGLPSEIQTDSRFFYEGLKSTLSELGIRVLCVDEIPKLAELRESLAKFMRHPHKGKGRLGRER